MSISRLVKIASAALLGMMLLSAVVFTIGINTIRIGGDYQLGIARAAELEADILPPPIFIVEPYAVAMEGLAHEGKRGESIKRLQALRKTYEERKRHWAGADIDPEVKAQLAVAIREADAFWKTVDEIAIPTLRSGDRSRYNPTLDALFARYTAQVRTLGSVLATTRNFKTVSESDAQDATSLTAAMLILLGLVLFGGVVAAALLLQRKVVSPLGELTEAARGLADGRDAAVPQLGRGDELGALAGAFDHFVRASAERQEVERRDAARNRELVDMLGAILTRVSEGDLRRVLETEFEGDYRIVGLNLNNAINSLRDTIQQVVMSAGSIRLAANEIADASSDLANRTQSNAAAIEQTSAALADVDGRIASTRDAAQSTAESAERARAAVEFGRAKAQSAATTMEEVRQAAASVDGVMEALDKIAFQTRVLAMNAAVEAGHAGEAGKGFAVVADLVSQLAARAEEEARNAREQLTSTAERIAQAVGSVGEVEVQFAGIVEDVTTVTRLVGSLTENARAQASAVAEISSAMRQMDIATQQNAAMVEQTSAAAANLLSDAQQLVVRTDSFQWERRAVDQPITVERRGYHPGARLAAVA
ncbi:methyl-accepting chemotaxis protein [Sphingomonas swuensis]|uniref:Methyl-accepting chemotaxis protein n=1 Tax=Sphingomonas swuensis TaxID=977800 RepID=A0ABP7T8C0_9SPHN